MSLTELVKKRAELERQIAALQAETRTKAITEVRALMAEHSLTSADLVAGTTPRSRIGSTRRVAAKYRDDQGNSWSGRGLKPKWLAAALAAGKSIEDFLI